MVNTCVVQGCVIGTAKQNVTLREFPKERTRRQLWRRFVKTTQSHCERMCHSYVCSPHFVSLDFINDVEHYGLRKETSHRQDCCPNHFFIKTRAVATLMHSVSRWTRRLGLAGPGTAHAAADATPSKEVFVN